MKKFTFPHPELTRIIGKPSTRTIDVLIRELKRNARSVKSTLGGGRYGHLFMVIPNEIWTTLPGTQQVIQPTLPGRLQINPRAGAAVVAVQQQEHQDAKEKYEKYIRLQEELKNQIINAIDPVYLDPIRCQHTDMVISDIPTILEYLKKNHGKLNVHQINDESETIKNFSFNPSDPIDVVLTKVKSHADLLDVGGSPITTNQMINLAILIINKTQIYKDALIRWNRSAQPKTWENFVTHMRQEYLDLREVNALTIKEASFHTTEVMQELKQHQNTLITEVEEKIKNSMMECVNYAMMHTDPQYEESTNTPPLIDDNKSDEVTILKQQLLQMQQQLNKLSQPKRVRFKEPSTTLQQPYPPTTQQNFQPQRSTQGYYQRMHNNRQRFPSRFRPQQQLYCWTHGAGTHDGWGCMNPAQGHQPSATFRDRMGGNNYRCRVAHSSNQFQQARRQYSPFQQNNNRNHPRFSQQY